MHGYHFLNGGSGGGDTCEMLSWVSRPLKSPGESRIFGQNLRRIRNPLAEV